MVILKFVLYTFCMNPFKVSLTSPKERTKLLFGITTLCSLLYHTTIFFVMFFLKVYPLCIYNIVSISVFAFLFLNTMRFKSFIPPYLIGLAEIIVHQVLATFYLGTFSAFYYFILLMGLLPFLFFENNFKFTVPVSIFSVFIFVGYENLEVDPRYELPHVVLHALRYTNMFITIGTVLAMLIVFTLIVFKIESYLQNKNEFLDKEMRLAATVQQTFFKHEQIEFEGWELAFYNLPMASVSGDMLDIYHRQDKIDGIGIFDISGHGLASGLVTMLVKNIIHREFYKFSDSSLAEMLSRINVRIIEEKADIENYLTGILVRINDNQVELVNAGHPFPILYKNRENEFSFIERVATSVGPIGMSGMPAVYNSQFLNMNIGDELILYTDGIIDTENEQKERFGKENFIDSIRRNIEESAEKQVENIASDIAAFRNTAPLNDDITFMILRKRA